MLKHEYSDDRLLVPLGHLNRKWNSARSNYSTYEQELLAGVLTLASQHRLIGDNPVLWLCDQESLSSFVRATAVPPESKKLKRWWVFLTQFKLNIKNLPGIKNELCDFTSRHNFDARLGDSSEQLARDAFQRMDIHLDLCMSKVDIVHTWKWWDFHPEHPDLKGLKDGESIYVKEQLAMFSRQGSLLLREGAVVVPQHKLEPFLGWLHKLNGHPGAEKLLYLFQTKFYTSLSSSQLLLTIKNLPPCIPCTLSKQNTAADRTVQGGLFVPRMVNSIVYVDFTEVDRCDDHDYILVITCGLTRFCRAFPCTKNITGEEAFLILFRDWI